MDRTYDVIIIGAGPNGLAAGAYLAKAGVKVLVLDSELELGGGLATEMVTIPPLLHNTHSIYHMTVDLAPIYKDLDLESRYNVKYVWPDLQFALPFPDGSCLCLYRDVDKTCRSIAAFSERDAEKYREFHGKLQEYFDDFLGPATYEPPMPALEQVEKLDSSDMGRELIDYSEMTPVEIVDRWFEDDRVKTLMLYAACHWGLEHDGAGVGYLALLYLQRATNYRLAVGGSHAVSSGMSRFILEHGGLALGSRHVTQILTTNGSVSGVRLRDGSEFQATKAIVSTLDPETTFLKLLGEDKIAEELAESVKAWEWEKWSLLQIHLALEERPHFTAADANPEIDNALVYVLGYESTQDLLKHWEEISRGEVSGDAGFICSFPSIHDPSQAPYGKVTGLISQMNPYDINGGAKGWLRAKFKERLAGERIAILKRYAPNVNEDTVLWTYVCTPADIENKFSNMVRGSIKQGAYNTIQMGFLRPNELCSEYRTPVKGLYLGGASVHPGGLVTFGPGYNAANAVAEDLGVAKWWSEPEFVTRAKEKGLL